MCRCVLSIGHRCAGSRPLSLDIRIWSTTRLESPLPDRPIGPDIMRRYIHSCAARSRARPMRSHFNRAGVGEVAAV